MITILCYLFFLISWFWGLFSLKNWRLKMWCMWWEYETVFSWDPALCCFLYSVILSIRQCMNLTLWSFGCPKFLMSRWFCWWLTITVIVIVYSYKQVEGHRQTGIDSWVMIIDHMIQWKNAHLLYKLVKLM